MISRCAGASVLCYTVEKNGQILLLLGQDSDGGKWSDFGGGLLNRWEPEEMCAARELKEETHNLVKKFVATSSARVRFQFKDHKNRTRHYTTFFHRLTFDPMLESTFAAARRRVRHLRLGPKLMEARSEKCRLGYQSLIGDSNTVRVFSLDHHESPLRSFFKTRLRHLIPYLKKKSVCSASGLLATIQLCTV